MSPKQKKKKSIEKGTLQKKVAELEAELKVEGEKSEKFLNQLRYARADLENLQKQTRKRIDEAVDSGNQRMVFKLLPILEELELAIEAAKKTGNDLVLDGVEMVRKKLQKMLEGEGVSPIEALGKTFDPHLHEAVLEVETEDQQDGTVVEEMRKGYFFKGKVLRASMVKVARKPSLTESQEMNDDE